MLKSFSWYTGASRITSLVNNELMVPDNKHIPQKPRIQRSKVAINRTKQPKNHQLAVTYRSTRENQVRSLLI